jgi:hypothetical protein
VKAAPILLFTVPVYLRAIRVYPNGPAVYRRSNRFGAVTCAVIIWRNLIPLHLGLIPG